MRSGDLVLLECKWEESRGLLVAQLDQRLEQFPEALCILGVLYPSRDHHSEINVLPLPHSPLSFKGECTIWIVVSTEPPVGTWIQGKRSVFKRQFHRHAAALCRHL